MFRTLVVVLLVTVTLVPLMPTANAQCNPDSQVVHVGGSPSVKDFSGGPAFGGCCESRVIPITASDRLFYLTMDAPEHHQINDEPHPNSIFFSHTTTSKPRGDPEGGIDAWLLAIENQGANPQNLVGKGVFSQKGPVDAGSSYVLLSPTTSVWLYEETNEVSGVQRGDTGRFGSDLCRDFTNLEVIYDSLVV